MVAFQVECAIISECSNIWEWLTGKGHVFSVHGSGVISVPLGCGKLAKTVLPHTVRKATS